MCESQNLQVPRETKNQNLLERLEGGGGGGGGLHVRLVVDVSPFSAKSTGLEDFVNISKQAIKKLLLCQNKSTL